MTNANCFIVIYIEVAPASTGAAAALVKQWVEGSRKDDGNLRSEVLQRSSPANQFVLVSIWRDLAAFEKSRDGAASKDIIVKLTPHLIAGIDTRVHNALIGGPDTARGQGTVFVVTHIDVPPPSKDQCIELVTAQVTASRKAPGCMRFEVFQQANRPNHFSAVEVWADRAAFDANIVAAHTKDFRMKLTPISGALYDERIYQAVK
jgi:quinol monooxygenase YgiN